jgi:Cu(I)/Ag(I) efflux system membrane fusion protein
MKALLAIAALSLGLALGASACKKDEHDGHMQDLGHGGHGAAVGTAKSYPIVGVVQGLQNEGQVVILKHQKIEGLMGAMTMGFELADPKLGAGLQKGDKISGTLTVQGDSYVLTGLQRE